MFELNQIFQKEIVGYFLLSLACSFFRKYKAILIFELLLNIYLIYFIFFKSETLAAYPIGFLVLISLFVFLFALNKKTKWLAYCIPILVLISARVLPSVEMADLAVYGGSWSPWLLAHTGLMSAMPMVGLSYIVFRWYRFLLDSTTLKYSVIYFLLYCFYVPIFYIGPITSYTEFYKSMTDSYQRSMKVYFVALLRILWGAFKFYPLASLFFQMTFSRTLMNNSESISLGQFLIGCAAYPAYLYLNFSGFIDMVIGVSALLGFNISKNFDRPYLATNVRDFWRRWHISLTELLKDLVHIPVLKSLTRLGIQNDLFKYSLAVFLVFLAMAYWHGNTMNFYIFSFIQVLALVIQRGLKRFTRPSNRSILVGLKRLAMWVYIAFSFFFFENSWPQIQVILDKLFI